MQLCPYRFNLAATPEQGSGIRHAACYTITYKQQCRVQLQCRAFRANVNEAFTVLQSYESAVHPSVQVLQVRFESLVAASVDKHRERERLQVPPDADVELAGHRILVLSEAQSPHSIWHQDRRKMCRFYW